MENRTVFDTNIWISYFLYEKFNELIWLRRECNVLFLRSAPSLSELKEVITRKKFQSKNFNVEKLIDFYNGITEFCETKPLFKDCPDPKDNFLFDLAIQGKANYLVSGDKKVLETRLKSNSLTLITLTSFKERLMQ
jgi:putative PIN family toxin of toxin-antitoxin system